VADKAYHKIMVIFPAVETFVQSLLITVPHSALADVLNPIGYVDQRNVKVTVHTATHNRQQHDEDGRPRLPSKDLDAPAVEQLD